MRNHSRKVKSMEACNFGQQDLYGEAAAGGIAEMGRLCTMLSSIKALYQLYLRVVAGGAVQFMAPRIPVHKHQKQFPWHVETLKLMRCYKFLCAVSLSCHDLCHLSHGVSSKVK